MLAGAGFPVLRRCPARCRPRCSRSPSGTSAPPPACMVTAATTRRRTTATRSTSADGRADRAAGRRGRSRRRSPPCAGRRRAARRRRRPLGRTTWPDDLRGRVVAALGPGPGTPPRDLRVAYTPMHGVGGDDRCARRCAAAGFADVARGARAGRAGPRLPDGRRSRTRRSPARWTCCWRSPRGSDADVAIANDPDADRCARGRPVPGGGWRMLTGDEVGVAARRPPAARAGRAAPDPLVATTIVSSSLLQRDRRGARRAATRRRSPGSSGSSGPATAPAPAGVRLRGGARATASTRTAVRDKDGISAAVARRATWPPTLKADGPGAARPARRAGRASTACSRPASCRCGWSDRRADRRAIGAAAAPPPPTPGSDDRRAAPAPRDVLDAALLDGVRVVVRPSGTEPKLKAYLEVVVPVADDAALTAARGPGARTELADAARRDAGGPGRPVRRSTVRLATGRCRPAHGAPGAESAREERAAPSRAPSPRPARWTRRDAGWRRRPTRLRAERLEPPATSVYPVLDDGGLHRRPTSPCDPDSAARSRPSRRERGGWLRVAAAGRGARPPDAAARAACAELAATVGRDGHAR